MEILFRIKNGFALEKHLLPDQDKYADLVLFREREKILWYKRRIFRWGPSGKFNFSYFVLAASLYSLFSSLLSPFLSSLFSPHECEEIRWLSTDICDFIQKYPKSILRVKLLYWITSVPVLFLLAQSRVKQDWGILILSERGLYYKGWSDDRYIPLPSKCQAMAVKKRLEVVVPLKVKFNFRVGAAATLWLAQLIEFRATHR